MKINHILPFYKYTNSRSFCVNKAQANPDNNKTRIDNNLNNTYFCHVSFDRKYKGKTKPDNVIKAVSSALKYKQDEKAANILSDFYIANGGYDNIIKTPSLCFTESKDENYTHRYRKDYNHELLLNKNIIAYREGKNIYSVVVGKKDKNNPVTDVLVNNEYLLNAFCEDIDAKVEKGEIDDASKTMQDFWIKNNGFNSIKNMMGRKREPYTTKDSKEDGFKINLDSGALLAEENTLKYFSAKRNIELDITPGISVKFDKDNNIEFIEAQGYFSDVFGIIHSYSSGEIN